MVGWVRLRFSPVTVLGLIWSEWDIAKTDSHGSDIYVGYGFEMLELTNTVQCDYNQYRLE